MPVVKDLGFSNLAHYGQPFPPKYNLTAFPMDDVKLSIFAGTLDTMADPRDVGWALEQLPGKPEVYMELHGYSHMDFVWGENSYRELYPHVASALAG